MDEHDYISPAVMKSANAPATLANPLLQDIQAKEKEVEEKNISLVRDKADLEYLREKYTKSVSIKWRKSILWCLEIDSNNWSFFLKNALGVSVCIAYKHHVEVTGDIKNKIATTLSVLHSIKKIGRVQYDGIFYYGLPKFFKPDLNTLKDEYIKHFNKMSK